MSLNESFMNRWKVAGEFERSKNITVGSNNPFGVMNAAFHSSPSFIQMLLYPDRMSNFVNSLASLTLSMRSEMRGRVCVFDGVLVDVSVVLARSDSFILLSNVEKGGCLGGHGRSYFSIPEVFFDEVVCCFLFVRGEWVDFPYSWFECFI